jgi:putative FmdB family regulatory protein
MPIFEYQCQQCGNEFELLVLRNSAAPECPACQGKDLKKLLSLSMVRSLSTRIRNYRDEEKRDRQVRQEKARSDDHHHDHDH